MSDKLEWIERHFVLLRCLTLDEAVADEKYECRPDLESFYKKKRIEDIIWDFADAGRYKSASELMGYVGHHRAVIWWGYQCLLSLGEEIMKNPPTEIDIDSIGKSFEPKVPEFAKVDLPKPSAEEIQNLKEGQAEAKKAMQELKDSCDPVIIKKYEQYMEIFYSEFEKQYGIRPLDLLQKIKALNEEEHFKGTIDMNSPIFKECENIKTQLQAVRQETLDTIHAVLPPEMPELQLKKAGEAARAVYNWIVAPDEVNAKICLEMGNACPDLPSGILAYCAFWAWGDMMAGQKSNFVVKTPVGLLANGFSKFLLMCALRKGGTDTLKQRYEKYFKIGANVLNGKNLWDKNVISGEVPHATLLESLKRELVKKDTSEVQVERREPEEPKKQEKQKDDDMSLEKLEQQVTQSQGMISVHKKYTRWKPEGK